MHCKQFSARFQHNEMLFNIVKVFKLHLLFSNSLFQSISDQEPECFQRLEKMVLKVDENPQEKFKDASKFN